MQLESHATPPKETPQQRYATLHRAIERGLDSDEIWRELADVSSRLGHGDESIDCLRRIRNPVIQQTVRARLVRAGILTEETTATGARHAAAPAASHAGPKGERAARASSPRLQDHVIDAVQYLFHQHMPLLVIMTTLAFPLVVGVGGFLTAGGSPLLLAAIAALPGVTVLAVVGAMGRQILVASSQGSSDVPNVPELGQLVADAKRFLADAGIVLGSLLAPSLLALALGAPAATTVPGLLIGAFFTPLAWALRQIRGDIGALSPTTLLRGVARCGVGYFGLVGVCWLVFAPAATAAWIVVSRPVWVQIAMVGPLCVVPLFVCSRLMGTWLDARRAQLSSVLVRLPAAPAAAKPAAARPATARPAAARPATGVRTAPAARRAAPAAQAANPRLPKRPAHLEHFTPPNMKNPNATAPARAVGRQPAAARPPAARPAPPRVRAPQTNASPAPAAVPPRAAARGPAPAASQPPARPVPPARGNAPAGTAPVASKPEPRAIEGRAPQRPTDQPDLTNLPGALVVTGRERHRHGAAARIDK